MGEPRLKQSKKDEDELTVETQRSCCLFSGFQLGKSGVSGDEEGVCFGGEWQGQGAEESVQALSHLKSTVMLCCEVKS